MWSVAGACRRSRPQPHAHHGGDGVPHPCEHPRGSRRSVVSAEVTGLTSSRTRCRPRCSSSTRRSPVPLRNVVARSGAQLATARGIHEVVMQEMLHMTLVANVMNTLGVTPKIYLASFVPKYPGPLPHSDGKITCNCVRSRRPRWRRSARSTPATNPAPPERTSTTRSRSSTSGSCGRWAVRELAVGVDGEPEPASEAEHLLLRQRRRRDRGEEKRHRQDGDRDDHVRR